MTRWPSYLSGMLKAEELLRWHMRSRKAIRLQVLHQVQAVGKQGLAVSLMER